MGDNENTGGGSNSTGGGSSNGGGFTQADVDRIVADRLRRERERYADYDDLKRKAGEADKSKSDIDKLTDAVAKLTQRAEQAERETLRRDIADRFKLPKTFARKLTGATAEDLEREAREMVDELKALGVKLDGDGDGSGAGGKDGAGGAGDGAAGSGGDGKDGNGSGQGSAGSGTGSGSGQGGTGGRPKETLTSGAAGAGNGDDKVDYGKEAEKILSAGRF
jgi:hypothetical protein